MKKCTVCGYVREETEFGWRSACRERQKDYCKVCAREYQRRWVKKHPQKRRAAQRRYAAKRRKQNPIGLAAIQRRAALKLKYGITPEQYDVMFAAQNGVCAICGRSETIMHKGKPKHLAIDHDHKANKNRSLLCQNCNNAIGHMQDSPARLRKAAAYLEFHQASGVD